MLKKSRQKKHFNKEWESMVSHLNAFYDSQNQEDLHRFRVQFKKVNALHVFLKGYSKRKKSLKGFWKIFKHAGLIRSAHINLQLIDQYQLENEIFKTEQGNLLKSNTGELNSRREAYFQMLKSAHEILTESFHDEDNKFVVKLYSDKLKQLGEFFSQPELQAEQLHEVRKEIKILLYYHNMLHKPLIDKIKLNTSYLNQLQDAIGKWNDIVSVIKLLETKEYKVTETINKLNLQSRQAFDSVEFISDNFSEKVILH